MLPFATTQIYLNGIMLSEKSHIEKQIPYDLSHVEFKKKLQINRKTESLQIQRKKWWLPKTEVEGKNKKNLF